MPHRNHSARPNIVFILADDLGWSDLQCYGSDFHETPNLDRFAESAMRFTSAYAAAPVCSPTRASILTGKCPARLNLTIWSEAAEHPPRNRKLVPPVTRPHLPRAETTIADVLGGEYATWHVGKWHLGDADLYPEAQGFDLNIAGTHWGCPMSYFYPFKGMYNSEEFRYIPDLEDGRSDAATYLTDRLTDEALRLMERGKDKPFFLNLCYYTVHTPIQGKPNWLEHFRAKVSPDRHHRNVGYAAMVASLDENVGRLLAKLDELGIADNTIVFFFSDNGGYIGKDQGETVTDNFPLRSGKGACYEGGIREPLIVRWPGKTAPGTVCATPVLSTDFYRTILDMAGYRDDPRYAAGLDGSSLRPLLEDPGATVDRDALCWHYPHYYETTTPVSAIRSGDWKLLEYFEDSRVELYDLAGDLGETTDLAARNPEVASRLRERLRAWREQVGARLPTRARA